MSYHTDATDRLGAITCMRAMAHVLRDVVLLFDDPDADELDAQGIYVRAVNALRQAGIACACTTCRGSGVTTLIGVMVSGLPGDADEQPCPSCNGTGDST